MYGVRFLGCGAYYFEINTFFEAEGFEKRRSNAGVNGAEE